MAQNVTFDPSELDKVVSVNPDADAYAAEAPVDEGEYMIMLKGPKDKTKLSEVKKDKNGNVYISFAVHGVIVDPGGPEHERAVFPHIFVTPTTRLQERSQTTTAISLLKRLGMRIESDQISHNQQKELMEQAIVAQASCRARVKWRLTKKTKNASGEDEYQDVYIGKSAFPDDPNHPGKKLWQIPSDPLDPKSEKIAARAEIAEFLPLQDAN